MIVKLDMVQTLALAPAIRCIGCGIVRRDFFDFTNALMITAYIQLVS